MSRFWGTVGWSLSNQGWFKSRAVSSRKQEHRVSTLGLATTLGLICKKRRMRDLRSTYPFFFVVFSFSIAATADDLSIQKQLKMTATPSAEKPQPVVRDKRVLDAAKMYEKYFLGQMMKAMRSTVAKSDLEKPSMGEGIYRDQLDDQYVDSWGERGGIGLADMIHDELLGKAEMAKMRRRAMKEAKGKVRTPMALTDRDVMHVRRLPNMKSGETIETVLVSLDKSTARPTDGPESVRTPWAATVDQIDFKDGKVVLRMQSLTTTTEPARKIELAYDGVPFEVSAGATLRAGQVVGHLAKGARGILIRQTLVQAAIKPRLAAGLAEPEETSLEAVPGPAFAPVPDVPQAVIDE